MNNLRPASSLHAFNSHIGQINLISAQRKSPKHVPHRHCLKSRSHHAPPPEPQSRHAFERAMYRGQRAELCGMHAPSFHAASRWWSIKS